MMRTPMAVGLNRLCPTSTFNPYSPRPALIPCNPTWCTQDAHGTSKGSQFGTMTAVYWKREPAQGWSMDLCASKREYWAHTRSRSRAEMYGVWIAACLAQPGDSIVLDNRAEALCASKPPGPQSSDYDLHDTMYQLISTKSL